MNILFSVCICAGIFSSIESKGNSPPSKDWQSYKTFYGKIYVNSVQEATREENFKANLKQIEIHNAKYEDGNATYSLEINEFSDLDSKTFVATMTGYIKSNAEESGPFDVFEGDNTTIYADNFDWRTQGKVSPVKNQKSCGSCWAFSAVGALESRMMIAGRELVTLSEQQLVDCDKSSHGCGGGDYPRAFNYISKAGGIQSDSSYPYTAKNGRTCKFSSSKAVLQVSGHKRVPSNVETIMQALKSTGPLCAAISGSDLHHYSDGVLTCRNPKLSHAVLIVGYGTESGKDYWIIKNSWGTRWGNKGFAKVSRNTRSDCGLSRDVDYPIIE